MGARWFHDAIINRTSKQREIFFQNSGHNSGDVGVMRNDDLFKATCSGSTDLAFLVDSSYSGDTMTHTISCGRQAE